MTFADSRLSSQLFTHDSRLFYPRLYTRPILIYLAQNLTKSYFPQVLFCFRPHYVDTVATLFRDMINFSDSLNSW